ncbi:hypothetical protein CIK05_10385 [Bdellovibrio sp. qaytius]|nr:hypothetical protein CIK05_10385 [Bdellovibrio sp. qaytius]
MKTVLVLILFFSNMVFAASNALDKVLAEGDIILQQSQSEQAAAIAEATDSVWTHVGIVIKKSGEWHVAEARGPLQITPIKTFIGRSRNNAYKVMRYGMFTQKMLPKLYAALYKYNQPYDIFFEFSDERIYCSELVYKVFREVTGRPVGLLQKIKDLKLDGPFVKKLIEERLTAIGRELNPEEPIITPVGLLSDENLTFVHESL